MFLRDISVISVNFKNKQKKGKYNTTYSSENRQKNKLNKLKSKGLDLKSWRNKKML